MENYKMINEFDWVIKVLESSKRETHIQTTDKLYKNFKEKWSENIDDSVMDIVFNKKYENKKQEMLKTFTY